MACSDIVYVVGRHSQDLATSEILASLTESKGHRGEIQGLRGFDAVHLESAVIWREGMGEDVVFCAFDVALWKAAGRLNFTVFPEDLPGMLGR